MRPETMVLLRQCCECCPLDSKSTSPQPLIEIFELQSTHLDGDKVKGSILLCENNFGTKQAIENFEVLKSNYGVNGMILIDSITVGQKPPAYGVHPIVSITEDDRDAVISYIKSNRYSGTRSNDSCGVASRFSLTDSYGREPPMFALLSGTSMACPNVSGFAARVKSQHPNWSPSIVRSAIMTTAISNLTTNEVKMVTRIVTNVEDDESTYDDIIEAPTGVDVQVIPEKLHFTKDVHKLQFQVAFKVSAKFREDLFGSIAWSNEKHNVRSPFVVIARSDATYSGNNMFVSFIFLFCCQMLIAWSLYLA
ncbi:hypothetical protein DH2020_008150 [Rehmannia glutinosa]|uniref:Subtilisin-like protease fibronectin type-III domain-containing protein n=1 Tax=Rehmannia glutinosa TaxID=99300 RepID=A0ABR0U050_REHGL